MDLFNNIRNNNLAMDDLKNILQEKIIINILSQDNLIDKQKLEKNIDDFLLILFEEDNVYEEVLEELTYNKMSGETKLFYLKDEYLKYLDCNYFVNLTNKSGAEKYIMNFKKDIIKTYNYYYYNQSELTFEFFEKVYEKVFLSKDNLDLIIRIIEKLINNERVMEHLDKKSIRNSFLPTILNYLLMFSVINTKSFIEFKLTNKITIDKLHEILLNFIKNKEKDLAIDKDLEEHINEVLNKINSYQLIYDCYKGDLTKLNEFDYNVNILQQLKNNQDINNNININQEAKNSKDEKKQKIKNTKDRIKLLMKKKNNNFIQKIESNEQMQKAIEDHIKDLENMKNKNDELMCFYCRNSIKLNSFDVPFGKLGLNIKDLFYVNSIKATLREEFSKLKLNDKDDNIYSSIMKKIYGQKFFRMISCGHYFHHSCFIKGCKDNFNQKFACPICLKEQNILIIPLTLFHNKYSFLQSEKFEELFKEDNENKVEDKKEPGEGYNLFYTHVTEFLTSFNMFKNDIKNYSSFLDDAFPYYQAYLNYFENVFYAEGTTFHKQQQIDNLKNMILSMRLIFNGSKNFSKNEIVKFIKETLFKLASGPEEKIYLYQYNDSYMHYITLFEKIILSLQILFDYEELKQTFKYILYIFLPYFCFGLYLKNLVLINNNKLNKVQLLQKLNLDDINKYLKSDNEKIMKYFKSFLKRFCFIKIISDYKSKNEDIINTFNDLSLKNIFSLIDMDDLLKLLPQNEVFISDIINKLPETFNQSEIFYKNFSSLLNFDKVLNSIFENVKENKKEEDFILNMELIIQFSPPKFNFITLDNNIFDFFMKYIGKKCCVCDKTTKHSYLCLICGEKVCTPKDNDDIDMHMYKCSPSYIIYIDMDNTKLHYVDSSRKIEKLYPLYVNKAGTGPKGSEISNEFNLSNEMLKTTIKNFISKDFYFN